MKAECDRDPTELNYNRYELKLQVMQRLKSQIMHPRTPSVSDHPNLDVSEPTVMLFALMLFVPHFYSVTYILPQAHILVHFPVLLCYRLVIFCMFLALLWHSYL